MTEKRFECYEHKGADYILDTPNKSLDFIEMLGDCLEAEEIVDLLNSLNDENEQLKKQLSSINQLIDNKIDEFKNGDYGDLPCNTIHMFLDLKQEIGDVE